MFSGGRDSTLAAVRLARDWDKLILVTVTSGGLGGISRVKHRLAELNTLLPANTPWVHVRMPEEAHADGDSKTCLTCHQAYIVAGVIMADKHNAKDTALGYSGYQSGWAEQTPYAIKKLTEVLEANGFRLVLPVADLRDKDDARRELLSNRLSEDALEQRCIRQIVDPELKGESLETEVNKWSSDLSSAITMRGSLPLEIAAEHQLNDFCVTNVSHS